jgi:hypothetical protein
VRRACASSWRRGPCSTRPDAWSAARPGVVTGTGEPQGVDEVAWRLPSAALAAVRPGRYFWQAVVDAPDGTRRSAAPRRFDVVFPRVLRRGPDPADVRPARLRALRRQQRPGCPSA